MRTDDLFLSKECVSLFFRVQGNLNSLGPVRLRAEHCLTSKEKRRGTVYNRNKTSRRDVFLFEREMLLCKRKDDANGKCLQYQWKETIQVQDTLLIAVV